MNELKKYLHINSIFSAFSGSILLIFFDGLSTFFEIHHTYVFPVVGLNLILFSIFIQYVLNKQLKDNIWIHLISGLDIAWVLGSFAIVLFGLFDLSKKGNMLIGVVAIWIAFLAYKQIKNTNRRHS